MITHASTFSGIGAPDLAAEMLGWKNLFYCEINPFCKKVLDYHFPKSVSYEDITKTDFSEWKGKVTVLTGGFPCQPFSFAGKRKGPEDDRYLWPYMLKCIEQVRPTWFIGENVVGITTMGFTGQVAKVADEAVAEGKDIFDAIFCAEGKDSVPENDCRYKDFRERIRLEYGGIYQVREEFVIEDICRALETIGYSVQPIIIPACAVGAPHIRYRVFIIAHNDENTDGVGCKDRRYEEQGHSDMSRHSCATSENGKAERSSSSDTDGDRGREIYESLQSKLADGAEPFGIGRERDVADTKCEGLQARPDERGNGISHQDAPSWACGDCSELYLENRWQTFPSVSPVYRGNDGLQPLLDYIAISEESNSMDRDSVIAGALASGKIEVDFVSGKIYSTRIRGHEGERIELKGADCSGYTVHTLSFNGVKKQCRAHQIVWIAANGIYDKDKFQVDHINRDQKDNRLENLRLVTAKENIANSVHKTPERMFTPEEEQRIQEMFYQGNMSIRELAQDFGCSKSHIFNVVHRFPNLQIPFSKWKRESLKAYGNAIVVQVMYEIFRAIDNLENGQSQ